MARLNEASLTSIVSGIFDDFIKRRTSRLRKVAAADPEMKRLLDDMEKNRQQMERIVQNNPKLDL